MKNIHSKLAEYEKKCDEVFLSKHLKGLIEEAISKVEQIE